MKKQIEFYQAGSEVVRYHTVHTLQRETVGHHSHGVAVLCIILDPYCSVTVLRAALFHDLSEHVTGDIPSPDKRAYDIGAQVSDIEDKLLDEADLTMPWLAGYEHRTLKLADIAQGALFCAREISLGNSKMRAVFDRYMSYAAELGLVGRERELFNIIQEMSK